MNPNYPAGVTDENFDRLAWGDPSEEEREAAENEEYNRADMENDADREREADIDPSDMLHDQHVEDKHTQEAA